MNTRITIGTTVQVISSGELWVKRAGFGFAPAVVAHDHRRPAAPITNSEIAVMMTRIMPSSQCMSRASSVAAGWKPIPPACGAPDDRQASVASCASAVPADEGCRSGGREAVAIEVVIASCHSCSLRLRRRAAGGLPGRPRPPTRCVLRARNHIIRRSDKPTVLRQTAACLPGSTDTDRSPMTMQDRLPPLRDRTSTRPPRCGLLRDAVAGADDGELFLERRRSEALVLRRRPR